MTRAGLQVIYAEPIFSNSQVPTRSSRDAICGRRAERRGEASHPGPPEATRAPPGQAAHSDGGSTPSAIADVTELELVAMRKATCTGISQISTMARRRGRRHRDKQLMKIRTWSPYLACLMMVTKALRLPLVESASRMLRKRHKSSNGRDVDTHFMRSVRRTMPEREGQSRKAKLCRTWMP